LQAFLKPRIDDAVAGKLSTKTLDNIFDEELAKP
jgi:hypothetical protein